jgi:DNA-binding CsgD family transcriptional regulator
MVPEQAEKSQTGLRLTLDIWHPDCWTLEVTDANDGGLLGHGVYTKADAATGRFTAYAASTSSLDILCDAIYTSPLTTSVWEMDHRYGEHAESPIPASVTRGLLVEYDAAKTINDALCSRGFIPDKPVRMADGREYWTVVVTAERTEVMARLDAVRSEMDAEICVQRIASGGASTGVFPTDALSARQRETLELAREQGYYTWPREVSASDLAAKLDISKATLLEHLRKAEAKLLGMDR